MSAWLTCSDQAGRQKQFMHEEETRMGGWIGETEIGELLCFLGSGARCLWGTEDGRELRTERISCWLDVVVR